MTIENLLITAIVSLAGVVTTLSGAIVILFKLYRKDKANVVKQLTECNEDRKALWKELSALKDALLKTLLK